MQAGEEGTSSAIAFALAGVLFIAAISTVLVYANDRIPPPTKSQPHDELAAEARALLYKVVLNTGTVGAWDNTANEWVVESVLPGLKCDRSTACTASTSLDAKRLSRLNGTADFTYEELRDLVWGVGDRSREFRITVTDLGNGTVYLDKCRDDPDPLVGCVNPATATKPAVAFLQSYHAVAGFTQVRVTVHVFLACTEGACLD